MRAQKSAIVIGVLLVVTLGIRVWSGGSTSPKHLDAVGGEPPYTWNEPFLDWPQAGGDLPCEEAFGPCGTPAPTLSPRDLALGVPLTIPMLKVPVGSQGRHELPIGTLVFMNGIHTRTTFKIANGDTKVYRVSQTHVEFRSLVDGAPPITEFAIDRPPVKGPEPVEAVLVWDVDWAADGAEMEITDLEVE